LYSKILFVVKFWDYYVPFSGPLQVSQELSCLEFFLVLNSRT